MGNCGTVLVIDRDRVFRAVSEEVLARWGCRVLAADSADDGLALAAVDRPDLAIVAVELQGLSGLAVLRELHDRYGDALPVVLVSSEHCEAYDRTAGLLVGAEDYLVKPVDPGELAARLRRSLRRAGVPVNGDDANGTSAPNGDVGLSRREREILQLLAEGRSQTQIAAALVISSKTVATHIQHLLSKLGVHSRAEAVASAYRRGLVEFDVHAHAMGIALVGAD
jgi:two-component system nitrate/nitrite response regulator NarL